MRAWSFWALLALLLSLVDEDHACTTVMYKTQHTRLLTLLQVNLHTQKHAQTCACPLCLY
jgi:hypothetical protein